MARGYGCCNATRHLSGAKKSSHKNSIYSCGYSGTVMAFSVDQVLDLLDSSGESEIEEDPGFLLPHESDSDCEEPLPYNSLTIQESSQPIASEDSDSSYEECIDQGIIIVYQIIKKWWRKVCFWLLEVATVNAYILYKKSNSSHTHLQFRRAVIESLASLHLQEAPERHRGKPFARHLSDTSAIVDPERLNRKPHFLSKREQRQCVVCSTPQKRRRSAFYCKTCHSHPTLCPDICHERYHTLANFKQ